MEKTKTQTEKIKEIAKSYLAHGQHDWDHTERVHRAAMHIGKVEGADLQVLEIAAFLHDIGRKEEMEKKKVGICHAEKGAELATEILKEFDLPGDKKENIVHCILVHRNRGKNSPETLEAKVLFDADKLDALGAIGVGRLFHFAGQFGGKVHNTKGINIAETEEFSAEDTAYREFLLSDSKLINRFYTEEGKRLAVERHDFMCEFFDRLLKEVDGEI